MAKRNRNICLLLLLSFYFVLKRYSHCVRLFFCIGHIYSRRFVFFVLRNLTISAEKPKRPKLKGVEKKTQRFNSRNSQHNDITLWPWETFSKLQFKEFRLLFVCVRAQCTVCVCVCEWIAICANRIYSWTVVRSDRWNLIRADQLKRDKDAQTHIHNHLEQWGWARERDADSLKKNLKKPYWW